MRRYLGHYVLALDYLVLVRLAAHPVGDLLFEPSPMED